MSREGGNLLRNPNHVYCVCMCVCVHQPLSLIHLPRLLAPIERIILLMSLLGWMDVVPCVCAHTGLCEWVIMETLYGICLRVNHNFCIYTICEMQPGTKGVAGFSSINMLSSPSAILEFHFSFDRKDFTDILQSCGFGQSQCSLSASC